MATTIGQMQGWLYNFGSTSKPSASDTDLTPRRSSRRSATTGESKKTGHDLILKRELDDLELKAGSCVLFNDPNSDSETPSIAIIKEIVFATETFIEIRAFIFYRMNEVDYKNLPGYIKIIPDDTEDTNKEVTPEAEEDIPEGYHQNDVFLTPILEKIWLKNIIDTCRIISDKLLREIVIDDSNSDSLFVCRRLCDENAEYFTSNIDWDNEFKQLLADPQDFYFHLKQITVPPSRRKRTTMSSPAKKSSGIVYKETSSDDELDSDSFSEDDLSDDQDDDEIIEVDDDSVEFKLGSSGKVKSSPRKKRAKKEARVQKKKKVNTPRKNTNQAISFKKQLFTDWKGSKASRRLQIDEVDNENNNPFQDSNESEVLSTSTVLRKAKNRLNTAAKLNSLPCRHEEFEQIYYTLQNAIETETGCCIYVSGTPGVGKTATIRAVIKQLTRESNQDDGKQFEFLEINGLKLVVPHAAYEVLWKKISGSNHVTTSLRNLEEYFEKGAKRRKPIVVLMDELDQIVTRNQSVMYNFFNWPSYAGSKLIVVAVANTMDLPERMLTNKISSRLGLTRIQFPGYTFQQLSEIIRHRLENLSRLNEGKLVISKDAIEFASRKVASVSGDARRSLIICVRAVEIAEAEFLSLSEEDKQKMEGKYAVSIMHVMKAINETTSTPMARYLNSLSFSSKILLAAILLRKRRTGLAEISLGDVIDELNNQFLISHFKELTSKLKEEQLEVVNIVYDTSDGNPRVRINGLGYILKDLEENGVLIQQQIIAERPRLIRLNVSEDEIMICFKRDVLMSDITIET